MKFLCFVDMHQDLNDLAAIQKKLLENDVDFILCLGDFTWFGENLVGLMEMLNDLDKKMYLLHGNHEDEESIIANLPKFSNLEFVHKRMFPVDDVLFVCHGGGGFAQLVPEFKSWVKENDSNLKAAPKIVLATHAPPYGTDLDEVDAGWHVGVKDYINFIKTYSPELALSGHIHESYKKKQKIGKTLLMNPGGDGEIFEL